MIKRLLNILVSILFVLFITLRKILSKSRRSSITILYFHDIKDGEKYLFSKQLDFISLFARFVYPLSEIDTINRYNVLITFDDGLISVLRNAQPELIKRKIPFVVFIPAGKLGEIPDWDIDSLKKSINERIMTESELKQLDKELCIIGSHTLSHKRLSKLSLDLALNEISHSKMKLEKILSCNVDLLSFPYGDYNSTILEMAQNSGYKKAFSIHYSSITLDWNGFLLGRAASSPRDWKIETLLKILGGYNWIGKRQKKMINR